MGPTKVTTSENYIIEGKDIVFNDGKKVIISDKNALITDNDGNKIYLDNFEYQIEKNIFKSIGYIKIQDKKENIYEFSQIYMNTKKKEILGSDSKFFINQSDFKIDNRNKPRIFSNSSKISKESSVFKKVFLHFVTIEKMTNVPWSIQSKKCSMTVKENNLL